MSFDDLVDDDPFARNGGEAEGPESEPTVVRFESLEIEAYLRQAWGGGVYERSAFHGMAVAERERQLRVDPRAKGKKR